MYLSCFYYIYYYDSINVNRPRYLNRVLKVEYIMIIMKNTYDSV